MASNRHARVVSKWIGFVAAIWVQAIAGNNYGFSNYSVALKAVGHYSQVQLNNLAVAKDVGKALGLLAGFAADCLPAWCILLIGSVEGLIGYGAQWLVLSHRLDPLPYWQMCVMLCLGGNSTTWMNTAILVTCIRNFRNNRGPVVGILKGYIGLSTGIFTAICTSLFSNDSAAFVLLLAVIPFGVCVIAMVFLRPVEPAISETEQEEENTSFYMINVLATSLAIYLLVYNYFGTSIPSKLSAAILLVLLTAPLYVPAKLLLVKPMDVKPCLDIEEARQPLMRKQDQRDQTSKMRNETSGFPELGEDHTIWQAAKRLEFWLLFISLLCGMGAGMVVMNNLGQIGETLGYEDVSSFVSLTSVWGFFGRIGSGLVSEHYLRSAGVPRPAWLAASQLLTMLGFALLILAVPGALYISSSIIGLCYGVRLAVSVPVASEMFGLKFFGLIYNTLIINIPLGSFLFSGLLAGILYDYEAGKQSGGSGNHIQLMNSLLARLHQVSPMEVEPCIGSHCFRITFVLMVALCSLGFILDLALSVVTKPLYQRRNHKQNT